MNRPLLALTLAASLATVGAAREPQHAPAADPAPPVVLSPAPDATPRDVPFPALPGDFNADGCVDLDDYFFLLDHWDAPDTDTDGDGYTDFNDFAELVRHWGLCV